MTTTNTTTQNANMSTKTASFKQIARLKHLVSDYGVTVNFDVIKTSAQASISITRIEKAITSGQAVLQAGASAYEAKPSRYTDKMWYAVININNVIAIKSFFGRFNTATDKAAAIYGTDVIVVTSNIEFAKSKAIELQSAPVQDEISTEDYLATLSLDMLKKVAISMNVKLGNSKKASTIIARILAVA